MKIKSKYDKNLNKYHIYYDKVKDKEAFRFQTLSKLNAQSDLFILIETHLGSINKPDTQDYARALERLLTDYGVKYSIKSMTIKAEKSLFGIFTSKNKDSKNFSIAFFLDQDQLTQAFFNDILCEYDLQIGYNLLKTRDQIFEDINKGYFDPRRSEDIYEKTFFDSMLFNKFLASDDLTQ